MPLDRTSFFATLVGAASALFSLVLAWTMWHAHGNPAFLLIWLTAACAMTAYTRFSRRWLAAFRRMCAPVRMQPVMHRSRCMDVEDVAFVEIPN